MGWRSSLRPAPAARDEIVLGRVVGVFGVSGEVRLHLENRESTLLASGREVVLQAPDGTRRFAHVSTRPGTNQRVIGRFRGLDDREEAGGLVGTELRIERTALPSLDDGEYYLADLVGMKVRCGDLDLGTVVAVYDQGPVEVIELDGERYVPSTADHIEGIDLEERVLYVKDGAVAV
ncbi:MAG: 16S rRNA processing protein RimM [Alphaproteobacteria bacterium]|nr:16S rRNA processing protein RimM [Alphaproteobacteria bacterium]